MTPIEKLLAAYTKKNKKKEKKKKKDEKPASKKEEKPASKKRERNEDEVVAPAPVKKQAMEEVDEVMVEEDFEIKTNIKKEVDEDFQIKTTIKKEQQ